MAAVAHRQDPEDSSLAFNAPFTQYAQRLMQFKFNNNNRQPDCCGSRKQQLKRDIETPQNDVTPTSEKNHRTKKNT